MGVVLVCSPLIGIGQRMVLAADWRGVTDRSDLPAWWELPCGRWGNYSPELQQSLVARKVSIKRLHRSTGSIAVHPPEARSTARDVNRTSSLSFPVSCVSHAGRDRQQAAQYRFKYAGPGIRKSIQHLTKRVQSKINQGPDERLFTTRICTTDVTSYVIKKNAYHAKRFLNRSLFYLGPREQQPGLSARRLGILRTRGSKKSIQHLTKRAQSKINQGPDERLFTTRICTTDVTSYVIKKNAYHAKRFLNRSLFYLGPREQQPGLSARRLGIL
ncbi:hypothetical protein EGW08_018915 [Elysia chlorotica]|uniref:Uncharacterized protein n=1 Tax=Elysia chlorotica TaxID=188477 RepID=A0A3S1H6P3_ELYCH|nr:hypothetical protein EGW08_018915 [Elysia chlorotica]